MYIDTHSHIYSEEFLEDRNEVVNRAKEARVLKIILPDIDTETRPAMLELTEQYPQMMYPLVGLHPTSVKENYRHELTEIEKHLGTHRFYGIGECGIDLYWDKTWYKEQIKVFEHQLGIAKDMNFPVIIHARDSLNEIFNVLKKYPYTKGIFHCFSGTEEQMERACGMDFLLGIGGIVTFKNSGLDNIIRKITLQKLVLETDSPYLTPVPHRGKRNESSYIPLIATRIADIIGEDVKKIEDITTQNAMNLFTLQPEND